jgi:hypothetical protein
MSKCKRIGAFSCESSVQTPLMESTHTPRWKNVTIILNRESGTLATLGPEVVAKERLMLLMWPMFSIKPTLT